MLPSGFIIISDSGKNFFMFKIFIGKINLFWDLTMQKHCFSSIICKDINFYQFGKFFCRINVFFSLMKASGHAWRHVHFLSSWKWCCSLPIGCRWPMVCCWGISFTGRCRVKKTGTSAHVLSVGRCRASILHKKLRQVYRQCPWNLESAVLPMRRRLCFYVFCHWFCSVSSSCCAHSG